MTTRQPAYCTILARNYLPMALALNDSLRRHGAGTPLTVFLIDATSDSDLPEVPGVRWMHPGMLGLDERTVLELAMAYELVEFATAVKPLVLASLLREHEQVAYLDPDTYAVSPMDELSPALDASPGGILLTPHYLEPPPASNQFSDGHLLHVGIYNLGFCVVDRRSARFLDWWWDHLRHECLHDPLAGLFVDQKWADLGSVYFDATSFRHPGYNVGVGNLHERALAADADGYAVGGDGDRLRLFHFHAFDPRRPELLSTRSRTSHPEGLTVAGAGADRQALAALIEKYATIVLSCERELGPQPAYHYNEDTAGRRITRRMRGAHRVAAMAAPGTLPSPFVTAEANAYERWRRSSGASLARRLAVSDVAKGLRLALPEKYSRIRRRVPSLIASLRGRFVEPGGMWK